MFFQKNLLTGDTPEYSQALNEVSVQELQSTPAESKSKNWIVLIILAIVALVIAPKQESKNKYNKSFKNK